MHHSYYKPADPGEIEVRKYFLRACGLDCSNEWETKQELHLATRHALIFYVCRPLCILQILSDEPLGKAVPAWACDPAIRELKPKSFLRENPSTMCLQKSLDAGPRWCFLISATCRSNSLVTKQDDDEMRSSCSISTPRLQPRRCMWHPCERTIRAGRGPINQSPYNNAL